jgi:hypothetical protein
MSLWMMVLSSGIAAALLANSPKARVTERVTSGRMVQMLIERQQGSAHPVLLQSASAAWGVSAAGKESVVREDPWIEPRIETS